MDSPNNNKNATGFYRHLEKKEKRENAINKVDYLFSIGV
jgi:hypothetical protein